MNQTTQPANAEATEAVAKPVPEMTDEELNVRLAALCGWKKTECPIGGVIINPWQMPGGGYTRSHQRYCSSASAVAKVRRGLTTEQAGKFIDALYTLLSPEPINGRPFTWLMMNASERLQTIALILCKTH